MSRFSLVLLNDSVEAFLWRDYNYIVDKTEDVRSLENEIIKFLEKAGTSRNGWLNVYIKLILEDIRRVTEHASDIAEAALNETVVEKISTTEDKSKTLTHAL